MELKRALGEVEELRDQLRNKDNELTDYKNVNQLILVIMLNCQQPHTIPYLLLQK